VDLFHQNDERVGAGGMGLPAEGPRITTEAEDKALIALGRMGGQTAFVPPPGELSMALAASMRARALIATAESNFLGGYKVRLTPIGARALVGALQRAAARSGYSRRAP
jgi:hypothetical protein